MIDRPVSGHTLDNLSAVKCPFRPSGVGNIQSELTCDGGILVSRISLQNKDARARRNVLRHDGIKDSMNIASWS